MLQSTAMIKSNQVHFIGIKSSNGTPTSHTSTFTDLSTKIIINKTKLYEKYVNKRLCLIDQTIKVDIFSTSRLSQVSCSTLVYV